MRSYAKSSCVRVIPTYETWAGITETAVLFIGPWNIAGLKLSGYAAGQAYSNLHTTLYKACLLYSTHRGSVWNKCSGAVHVLHNAVVVVVDHYTLILTVR